ncbi:MAG: putative signal transduction protein with domain [Rhodospirillales bacterium]|jgi:CBS domain-containing protein|nr:putative signal transduction protein with domain [Rhodospirillales bacterium]
MNVEAILRTKGRAVATIRSDATVADCVRELKNRGIGALIVSSDGKHVDGIISERDVVHALADRGGALLTLKIDALMTRKVQTCTPEDTVSDLMERMTARRIRHLPVLQDGVLCGLVSIGDLVKNRIEEVVSEADSLRTFIAS